MKHALENIRRNGGKTDGKQILIRKQLPEAVRFEESFSGLQPVEKKWLGMTLSNTVELTFEGNGFVIKGDNKKLGKDASDALVGDVEVYIDGLLFEKVALPISFTTRRYEISWKYDLKPGKHTVQLKLLNPNPGMQVYLTEIIVYNER
jgi:hypothetical protein